jgi:hypothetical protein
VLLPTRDKAVELPKPPAEDLRSLIDHEVERYAVPDAEEHMVEPA